LLNRIIDDIFPQEYQDDINKCDIQNANCRILFNFIADSIAKLEYTDFSSIPNNLFDFSEVNLKNDNIESFKSTAKEYGEIIILELNKMLRKQQNIFLSKAKKYIEEHYDDINLSLSCTAKAVGISPTYLSRLFNINLCVHFTEFVKRYRMKLSIKLLLQTESPINEIASKCGFYTVQNYNRVFKQYTGKTPKQYRNTYAKNDNQAMVSDSLQP
jgi:AraC-like DNA-binding protein